MYLFIFIVVQVQLSPFSCHQFPTPHLPPSILPPFDFVRGSFIHVPWRPFSFFPLLSPFPLPSGYCQLVLYFNVFGHILLACLLCWLGSTYRWGHTVFVFHCLTYSIWYNAFQFHPYPKNPEIPIPKNLRTPMFIETKLIESQVRRDRFRIICHVSVNVKGILPPNKSGFFSLMCPLQFLSPCTYA